MERTFESLGGTSVVPIDIVAALPRHQLKRYKRRKGNPKRIVVHCTDGYSKYPRQVARYDVGPNHISSSGCPGITYHHMYSPDHKVYKTLEYDEISWHAGIWNKGSLGVALMYRVTGDDGTDTHAPPILMYQHAVQDVARLCLRFDLSPDKVKGHRELLGTGFVLVKGSKRLRKTCPGLQVDMIRMRSEIGMYMQLVLKAMGHYAGEIDGIFGRKSRAALRLNNGR